MAQSTPNLRDLGGTVTAEGRTLQFDRLLRSAVPFDDDIAPEQIAWPPKVVVDLRSEMELRQRATLSGPELVHAPLLSQLKPDAHLDGTLIALYRALLESAPELLVEVVRAVAETDGPVLVHCAAGKDRTGISVALILRLLGVDRQVVMDDYVATNANIDAIDERLRTLAGNERRDELPREYFHVVPEALDHVMDHWDEHPGATRGWFLAVGGDEDLLTQLQHSLLDDLTG